MSIFTVQVTSSTTPVEVYGGVDACLEYLRYSDTDGAVAFVALDADGQKRKIAQATRYLDSLSWQGVPTGLAGGTPTTLQFPRTGLTDAQGAALDATDVPALFVEAVFEMTALIAADPSVTQNADTGSNVSSMGAGPASLSFFRPSSVADGNATVLPTAVDRLVGRWLASSAALIGGVITGGSSRSAFRDSCGTCGSVPCTCWGSGRRDVTWPV